MSPGRTLRHLFSTRWGTRRRFTAAVRARIEAAIAALEQRHAGEIRFAIETAFDLPELWYGMTPRERAVLVFGDRKSTRLNSSHSQISYAVFCLKKKKRKQSH